jgi:signal transduction histidine kinase
VTGQLADHAEPAAPAAQNAPPPVVARPWRVRRAVPIRAALWVVAGALAVFDLVLIQTAGELDSMPFQLAMLAACSTVAGGLVAWKQLPGNQVGPIMTLAGFNFLCIFLIHSRSDPLYTIGLAVQASYTGLLVHLLLAYPAGRLARRERRLVVVAGYAVPGALWLAHLLVHDPNRPSPDNGGGAFERPDNLLLVTSQPTLDDLLQVVVGCWNALLLTCMVVVLVWRWRHASPIARRLVAPVLWVGVVWAAHKAWQWLPLAELKASLYRHKDGYINLLGTIDDLLGWAEILVLVAALLFAAVLRQRLARSGVADLVLELDATPAPGRLQQALARSLGDPSVRVLYRTPQQRGWVDSAGRQAAPPADTDPSRAVVTVTRGGRVVAAIVHDAALRDQPLRVRGAAATAGLALENERLGALARARLDEVRASRARVVAAGDAARRRIERDLHDGAQQYLIALYLQLRQVEAQTAGAPAEALEAELEATATAAERLNQELRALADGIHPAALSERGLPGALAALAATAPVPVRVLAVPERRLPEPVEAAAWFVVSELVTNAAKFAQATGVTVQAVLESELHVRVEDDGVGGVVVTAGGGLEGLRDRVAALRGRLEVDSPAGAGTRVDAWLPLDGTGR